MYELVNTTSGKTLAIVEEVTYIKIKNGIYIPATRQDAIGIAYDSTPYNLFPHSEIADTDTIIVREAQVDKIFEEQKLVSSIAFVSMFNAGQIDDVTASEHVDMFNSWVENYPYKTKEGDTPASVVEYRGSLYRCILSHTSQADWAPDVATTLWKNIADPRQEYPEWSQPIGAFDTYSKGDKVTYKGNKYVSNTDNNVWAPDVYGWDLIIEE